MIFKCIATVIDHEPKLSMEALESPFLKEFKSQHRSGKLARGGPPEAGGLEQIASRGPFQPHSFRDTK